MRPLTLLIVIFIALGWLTRPVSTARAATPDGARSQQAPTTPSKDAVLQALRKAVEFYRTRIATEGGYHYYYAEDLSYGRSESASACCRSKRMKRSKSTKGRSAHASAASVPAHLPNTSRRFARGWRRTKSEGQCQCFDLESSV